MNLLNTSSTVVGRRVLQLDSTGTPKAEGKSGRETINYTDIMDVLASGNVLEPSILTKVSETHLKRLGIVHSGYQQEILSCV